MFRPFFDTTLKHQKPSGSLKRIIFIIFYPYFLPPVFVSTSTTPGTYAKVSLVFFGLVRCEPSRSHSFIGTERRLETCTSNERTINTKLTVHIRDRSIHLFVENVSTKFSRRQTFLLRYGPTKFSVRFMVSASICTCLLRL